MMIKTVECQNCKSIVDEKDIAQCGECKKSVCSSCNYGMECSICEDCARELATDQYQDSLCLRDILEED